VIKINCDMCGAETKLFKTLIESTEMNVCRDCSRFGKVISEVEVKVKKADKTKKNIPDIELVQVIAKDYAKKIKNARENQNLDQKDFAKKLNEKVSLIHKIETGSFEPGISLTRKLEKFLKIKLIKQHEEVRRKGAPSKSDAFTIGDLIKIKK